MSASIPEVRDPATGLKPRELPGVMWDKAAIRDHLGGTDNERRALCVAHGYDIDAVLAASAEFRAALGGVPPRYMSRGEALHIARALAAVRPGEAA